MNNLLIVMSLKYATKPTQTVLGGGGGVIFWTAGTTACPVTQNLTVQNLHHL